MGGLVPDGLGRATVYGLLRHAPNYRARRLYLPHPERLPLKNIPIVGRFGPHTTDERLSQLLDLAARSAPAGCLQVELDQPTLETLRRSGRPAGKAAGGKALATAANARAVGAG